MSPDLNQAREVFIEAIAGVPADRWEAFLAERCGDEPLRDHVRRLLRAHVDANSFLDHPAVDAERTSDQVPQLERGAVTGRVGPYKLLQSLGEGGMGAVWMAEQLEPVQRRVALKLIRPGMDGRRVAARFEAERQALALMDHPNIARVLDAGSTADGHPYFAMELVKGSPFTTYCDEKRLGIRERLGLFASVCLAVQHAHQKGIIHRDLKPSNVLVAPYDGKPVPKVIDFGIAKATGPRLTDKTLFTEVGAIIGTLEYMSPEQAELNNLDVDTRSDVYSLGVMLYELLTGSTPLDRKRLKDTSLQEALRRIREEEAPAPGQRLSTEAELPTVAANRGLEPGKLTGMVRGELEWIVMRCLEKDRERRYESAGALALDLGRYLADEPVLARPPSLGYRLRKFARRNRGRVLAAALALVFLSGMTGLALAEQSRRSRQRAEEARIEERAEEALTAVQSAYAEDRLTDARAALHQAEGLLGEGGYEELRRRVRQWGVDLALVARLDEARLRDLFSSDDPFDVRAEYEAAFREYGIDLKVLSPIEAAERVTASAIKDRLIVALDEWVDRASRTRGATARQPAADVLAAVARRADPDRWRNQLRGALVTKDRKRADELARHPSLEQQPVHTLILLHHAFRRANHLDRALGMSRLAQRRAPNDFHATAMLCDDLQLRIEQKEEAGDTAREVVLEVIGHYRAIRLIRPDSVYAQHNLAGMLAKVEQYDEAISCCQGVLRLRPEWPPTLSVLGITLYRTGRREEGKARMREAIARAPRDGRQALNLGLVLLDEKDYRGAVEALVAATRLRNAAAHFHLGLALVELGRKEEALRHFAEAARRAPRDAMNRHNLGVAQRDTGRFEQALASFRKAAELGPRYADAYVNLGVELHRTRRADEAITALRRAIELKPDRAEAHSNLGTVLRSRGDLAEAIAAYRTALRLAPENTALRANLGSALLQAKQFDEALGLLRTAAERAPMDGKIQGQFASALRGKGLYPESLAAWDKALRLLPRDAKAHYGRGQTLHDLRRYAEAQAGYRRALELGLKEASAWSEYGVALYEARRVDEAIRCQQAAVQCDPRLATAHNNLGFTLLAKRRYPAALAAFRRAIEVQPDHFLANHHLGTTLMRIGQVREGVAQLHRALALRPNDNATHWELSGGHARLGEWDKVVHHIDAIERLGKMQPVGRMRRGVARAMLGRWAEARNDLAVLRAGTPSPPDHWSLASAVLLLCDDVAGHQWWCRTLANVQDRRKDHQLAELASRTCTLDLAPLVEPARALKWAERAVAADKNAATLHALGRAQLRAGEWKKAIASCEASLETGEKGIEPLNWLVLALAHQRLGQAKEAREYFAKAERSPALTATSCPRGVMLLDWVEMRALYREARAALAAPPAKVKS